MDKMFHYKTGITNNVSLLVNTKMEKEDVDCILVVREEEKWGFALSLYLYGEILCEKRSVGVRELYRFLKTGIQFDGEVDIYAHQVHLVVRLMWKCGMIPFNDDGLVRDGELVWRVPLREPVPFAKNLFGTFLSISPSKDGGLIIALEDVHARVIHQCSPKDLANHYNAKGMDNKMRLPIDTASERYWVMFNDVIDLLREAQTQTSFVPHVFSGAYL